jgi:diguanylate cyclase (GGDEF)-like protein
MEGKIVNTRKITTAEAQACAAEAIHIIGNIQPHGFQLIIDPETLKVVQYSENVISLLNQYVSATLPLTTQVLHSSIFDWLSFSEPTALDKLAQYQTIKIALSSGGIIALDQWECIGHLVGKWISLEFIPTAAEAYDSYYLISQMNSMIEVLRNANGTQEIFDTITTKFQQYTEFDRVMMYRFLPDWSGEVVSEAVSAKETVKFLNMRFPADDIPQQARALYTLNKVRVFANSEAQPTQLTPPRLPDGQYLDQSYSLLRNISDMHRTYLINMGVKATLTLSILVGNQLWGLIVFHHNTPKTPPNHVVAQLKVTCELFSEIISSYLMPAIQMHQITHLLNVKNCIETTFSNAKMCCISERLFEDTLKKIYSVTGYDYIGIIYGDHCYTWCKEQFTLLATETKLAISRLFKDKSCTEFQSYQLHLEHDPIPGLEQMVGIYVMRSTFPVGLYVFFGRNEVIKGVNWGGKPNTVNIVVKDNQRHLEPRSSFALWRENVRGQCDYWTEQDTKTLEYFFASCKDFTSVKSNELLMEKLEQNAHYDALTQLANRAYFKSFIETLKSNHSSNYVSLLFIDLDNFKDVNDFMGHDTGDRLLITIAERLRGCSRPSDLVVRLGGDEFIIVFSHDQQQELTKLAEKVVKRIAEPIFDHEHTIVITPSVGVVSCGVQDIDFNEMLKRADIAMYSAKNKGKNAYHIFDSKDQDAFNKKAILTLDLRDYINSEVIELHFQAQCDFNKNVTGAETLARWKHPEFGYINPEVFIQIAEMNNLIKPLSLKVFTQACAQLAIWQAHHLTQHFETLSINISPSLLLDKQFQQDVSNILAKYPSVHAKNIRLEITESIFMQNYELAIENLNALRKVGFSVSLDDFGTGYSSLNYLWKLPIDEVKIDKSFISNMSQDESLFTMVESIIALCKKLELEVVAEGVESNVEFNILKGLGCDTCQGYFFCRPMPSEQFLETYINNVNSLE